MLKSSRIRKHRSKRYRSRIERTVHVSIRSSTISQKTRSVSLLEFIFLIIYYNEYYRQVIRLIIQH